MDYGHEVKCLAISFTTDYKYKCVLEKRTEVGHSEIKHLPIDGSRVGNAYKKLATSR